MERGGKKEVVTELRETPTFNVKAVSQETGVKADTLRAWERRYGLPEPDRSPGGHRLYSQRDIDIVKWLVNRQGEGLSISNAVDLWRQLIEEGHQPLTMAEYRGAPQEASQAPVVVGDSVEELRDQWIAACRQYDGTTADAILDQAFGLYSAETVVLEIIRAGIAEIGLGWYRGAVVVQQEHFASEQAVRRLEALISGTPPASRSEKLLLVCPPGEQHSLGLLLLALLLRRRGWPVTYLGANVPLQALQSTLTATEPRLVVSLAQQVVTAASLRELSIELRESGPALAYGGAVFSEMPALRDRIAGHYLGDLIRQAPGEIENLIAHPRPIPQPAPVPASLQRAVAAYADGLPKLEAAVVRGMRAAPTDPLSIESVNEYMAQSLMAALHLGEPGLLAREIRWVADLIEQHTGAGSSLAAYLEVYRGALQDHIGEPARPIIDLLERID